MLPKGLTRVPRVPTFPSQAILPKLAAALGQMDINPAAQQLEPWGWAMAWKEVVSAQLMAGLLERAFFPRCAHP